MTCSQETKSLAHPSLFCSPCLSCVWFPRGSAPTSLLLKAQAVSIICRSRRRTFWKNAPAPLQPARTPPPLAPRCTFSDTRHTSRWNNVLTSWLLELSQLTSEPRRMTRSPAGATETPACRKVWFCTHTGEAKQKPLLQPWEVSHKRGFPPFLRPRGRRPLRVPDKGWG